MPVPCSPPRRQARAGSERPASAIVPSGSARTPSRTRAWTSSPSRISPFAAVAWSAVARVNASPVAGRRRAASDEHLAGLDARAHRAVDALRALQLEGGADGAQGVVLVQLGEAEDAEHRVAGEALDGAAVALDHGAAGLGEAVQQRVPRLGVGGRSGEPGGEDAHEPPRRCGPRLSRRSLGWLGRGRGAGAASAGSCARIAPSSARSRSPGSIPSSSTSARRASW